MLIAVLLFKITLERSSALENSEPERKQFLCHEHLPIPSFKLDLLGFMDYKTQLIRLGIEKSTSVIQIWVYFTLICICITHGRLNDLKLLTKRSSKTANAKKGAQSHFL